MFRTTLVNLAPEAASASPDIGPQPAGDLLSHEVIVLLERFRALDPIQNINADPEIVFEVRRRRHIVRTGQGRLFFHDPRNVLEQTLVLTPEEIVAELDGSAAASRTRPVFAEFQEPAVATVALPPPPKPVSPLRTPQRLVLSSVALFFTGYLLYPQFAVGPATPAPAFVALDNAQQTELQREALAGVYLTGTEAGHHGIALGADGTMKLFQLNAGGPPSLMQGSFHLGRIGADLAVQGSRQSEVMQLTKKDALTYFGESYHRIP